MSKTANNIWIEGRLSNTEFEIMFEEKKPSFISFKNNGTAYHIQKFTEKENKYLTALQQQGAI